MSPRFYHYLKIVAAVHVVVAVIAIVISGWRGCVLKEETVPLPVEFVVEAPSIPAPPDPVPAEPVPPRPPEPPEKVAPPKKEKPKKPRKRKKIDVSEKIVQRPVKPPPRKTLTDREIKELLSKGAKIGERTSIPDDESRCLARIHDVLYSAWLNRPSATDVGNAVSKVKFLLGKDGGIKTREMVVKSGNPEMDSSVMAAVNSVMRITGLSPAFLERHNYSVTVSFRLE